MHDVHRHVFKFKKTLDSTFNATTFFYLFRVVDCITGLSIVWKMNLCMLVWTTAYISDQAGSGAAVFGGVVKGAGTFFSSIKDMSNKVVQSVAG